MLVTEIKPQKRDETRYNIFIDGEYAFALPMEDILYFKLKEGCETSEETVRYIRQKLIYIRAQDAALHYIGYKMRTEEEICRKLREKDFAEDVISEVMEFLRKYGYADDHEYCEKFIRERLRLHPKSRYALRIELRQKGVAAKTIEAALGEAEIDEAGDALRWLEKKARNWPPEGKEKKRLQDFLLRKGYSYDIIREAFLRMDEGDTEQWRFI